MAGSSASKDEVGGVTDQLHKCTISKWHEIYPHDHIKQHVGDERILGTLDQFCAAFYHVPKWESEENNARDYVCLDEKNCIIAREAKESIDKAEKFAQKAEKFAQKAEEFATNIKKQTDANKFVKEASDFTTEAQEFSRQADKHVDKLETCAENITQIISELTKNSEKEKRGKNFEIVEKAKQAATEATKLAQIAKKSPKGWDAQPKTGVALVKFENHERKILYEARYTNWASRGQNSFKEDIKERLFKELVQDNPKGTITLYLTLQLSNRPTTLQETPGTGTDHSCCIILQEIVTILQDNQEIKLCVKAARINQSQRPESNDPNNVLEVNESEIKELMERGVKFSGMTPDDWDYLFTLTKDNHNRESLDQEVESIFRTLEKAKKNV